ncbi:hypothetical protein PCAR4_180138 [Paraburkholderia caribensis]|nr:hypothetical protein PCAR4_180138 [Paraburkholderia caribensis]
MASRPDGRKIGLNVDTDAMHFAGVAAGHFRGEFWQANAQRLVARTFRRQRAIGSCGRILFWNKDRKMHWQPRIAHLMPAPRESRPAAQRHVRHSRSCSCL